QAPLSKCGKRSGGTRRQGLGGHGADRRQWLRDVRHRRHGSGHGPGLSRSADQDRRRVSTSEPARHYLPGKQELEEILRYGGREGWVGGGRRVFSPPSPAAPFPPPPKPELTRLHRGLPPQDTPPPLPRR